jgi:hypothetical protein
VALTARLVDVDTGEILGVADGKGESQRESSSMLGGGSNWHGFGGGNADFGSSDFQSTIIGEAVKAAVEQTSTEMIGDKDKLVTRTVTVQGLVAAVDGGPLVLNVGAKAGVKVGDQLNVERVTKEIKDPATGQLLRRLSEPAGVVKVTDVDDVSSIATPVSAAALVGEAVGGLCFLLFFRFPLSCLGLDAVRQVDSSNHQHGQHDQRAERHIQSTVTARRR